MSFSIFINRWQSASQGVRRVIDAMGSYSFHSFYFHKGDGFMIQR